MASSISLENHPAVNNLRDYLRIRSEHPNVNYDECLKYLRDQANGLGLSCQVFEVLPKKPVLVMTWTGEDPTAKSILLNSHMDIVPVYEKSWKYPPFEARLVDGVIYGRGAIDMKTIAVQYIEAVRKLKANGVKLKRTVHLSFVPDEEIGGHSGMGEFVKSEHFRALNVGFALDEGMPNLGDEVLVFNGERSIWHINIICPGTSGHGSLLLPNNCGEKLRYIIDKFMDLRAEAKQKLADNPQMTIGDVTTVNLTIIRGGIQNNVVPEEMTASFDLRLALSVNFEEFENMIKRWCSEAGSGVTYTFDQKDIKVSATRVDNTNPYWIAFKNAAEQIKVPLALRTFPGGTDSRYLRSEGIPALGVSPLPRTAPALHEHNESVTAQAFLNGIQFYEAIVPAIANVA